MIKLSHQLLLKCYVTCMSIFCSTIIPEKETPDVTTFKANVYLYSYPVHFYQLILKNLNKDKRISLTRGFIRNFRKFLFNNFVEKSPPFKLLLNQIISLTFRVIVLIFSNNHIYDSKILTPNQCRLLQHQKRQMISFQSFSDI